jgi:chromosome segregation ATPase
VEHPARSGYELKSEPRPAETTAGWMRFRLPVAPKQTASLTVQESRPLEVTYMLSNLRSEMVAMFIKEKSINRAVEDMLKPILAQKAAVSELESQVSARKDQTEKIFDDQQRLRENIKALKGSAEEKALILRYTRQLDDQETWLETLKKETEQIEERKDRAEEQLNKLIEELSFEVAL